MKFSIVTPTYNRAEYLAQTIESVLTQKGDFEIEYLIIDGASTDATLEMVKTYQRELENKTRPLVCRNIEMKIVSERDRGSCEAYAKGFALATGDVMSGLGSDDILLPGALATMEAVFQNHADIRWARGRHALMNTVGTLYAIPPIHGYYRPWLARGVYGRNAYWIAFEATFWRRSLWEAAGNIPGHLREGCDYALWTQFGRHASLCSVDAAVVGFRMHEAQRSKDTATYRRDIFTTVPERFTDKGISLFFRVTNAFPTALASLVPYLYVLCFGNHHFQFIRFDKHGHPRLVTSRLFT